MIGRKQKFAGIRTKWEKRRIARRFARQSAGKKPLVEPLKIAQVAERRAALKKGKMVFYDGKMRIIFPLISEHEKLVGAYKTADGRIIVLRVLGGGLLGTINIFELKKSGSAFIEKELPESWFQAKPDWGHMFLAKDLRGEGLGLKVASKVERYVRAKKDGLYTDSFVPKFKKIYPKLGYKPVAGPSSFPFSDWEKRGKFQPKDDLDKFHRIEAIDPKDGKVRIFTFPVKKK